MMTPAFLDRLIASGPTAAEYDLFLRLYSHADDYGRVPLDDEGIRTRRAIAWRRTTNSQGGRSRRFLDILCAVERKELIEIVHVGGHGAVHLVGWETDQTLRARHVDYLGNGHARPTEAAARAAARTDKAEGRPIMGHRTAHYGPRTGLNWADARPIMGRRTAQNGPSRRSDRATSALRRFKESRRVCEDSRGGIHTHTYESKEEFRRAFGGRLGMRLYGVPAPTDGETAAAGET
jgi:hypothetical protein